jgi:asparagine synthase (glutamine-hydrolysing)
MCGIAGFSGQFDRDLLARMNAVQAHRGPDDCGELFIAENGIGFAHRRLSIIDLSPAGHQPMKSADGTAIIVYNGELYNYRELRSELQRNGFVFTSQSDTEVLLDLYIRDGEKMLGRLSGIFAFALWDAGRERLFIARDGLGVKPLYYSETSRGFLFASEIKALLEEPSVERSLDYESLMYHLTYLWCPAPHTALSSVRKLEPGHAMLVRDGHIEKKWQYYDIPVTGSHAALSEEEAIQKCRDILERVVKRQLVADVPVGAFLSGGLDSSAVVAMARRAPGTDGMKCFTIAYRDKEMEKEGFPDDLPYARNVARALSVDLEVIDGSAEIQDGLENMIWHLDEPLADPAALHVLSISALARNHGINVVLSGAGGDDIFSGYRRHYALLQERYWSSLPSMARSAMKKAPRILPGDSTFKRRLTKALAYADCDGDERLISYFYWTAPALVKSLFRDELRGSMNGMIPSKPLIEALGMLPSGSEPLDRMLYLEGKYFLADHNLLYTDKMSMAASVEVRVPLLDPELVAFASSLPVSMKQRGKTGKWILKKAMETILPDDVIYRPKSGFFAPVRLLIKGALRPLMNECLAPEAVAKRAIFDAGEVSELIRKNDLGEIDGAYTLLTLLCIELWCRRFLDRA